MKKEMHEMLKISSKNIPQKYACKVNVWKTIIKDGENSVHEIFKHMTIIIRKKNYTGIRKHEYTRCIYIYIK